MKPNNIYNLKTILQSEETMTETGKGKWVPARPVGMGGIRHRLRMAWLAFTGKADLVRWPANQ